MYHEAAQPLSTMIDIMYVQAPCWQCSAHVDTARVSWTRGLHQTRRLLTAGGV